MAGAYQRASDKARGKAGKWTGWYLGEAGRKVTFPGTVHKTTTEDMARRLEESARRVSLGLAEPGDQARRVAATKSVATHVEDYRLTLIARAAGEKHARSTAVALTSLLADASITAIADLPIDRIQEALGRLRARRSPRTTNHALAAFKAFASWLEDSGRLRKVPRGLRSLKPYSQEVDRVRERRAMTRDEVSRLLATTEAGPTVYTYGSSKSRHHKRPITGPMRAAIYRLALGTGFRADELRTLTRESFSLDGPAPFVTVEAAYSKNGKKADQPISRDLAERIRPFVEATAKGERVLTMKAKTSQMFPPDLAAAGIAERGEDGRAVDFHALRHTFVSHLVEAGENIKTVQVLARHSDPALTLGIYAHAERSTLRDAIERPQGQTQTQERRTR
jgi:integrase/recombinase XerD